MRTEYLRSFLSVVNCKSFSVAAKELYLSQPTVSMHIKHLEQELGVQLFVRSTKNVIPSESGLMFYPYAMKIVEAEGDAKKTLNQKLNLLQGTVTIATSSVPGRYLLPEFMGKIRKTYSGINYKISEGDSLDTITKVMSLEADFGVCGMKSTNKKCVCIPLLQDRIVLITPNTREYREMNGRISINQLKRERFVRRENGSGTKEAEKTLERALGLDQKILETACVVSDSEMVVKCVRNGLGIAFVSNLAAKEAAEDKDILVFEFSEVDNKRQLYIIYHEENPLSSATEETIWQLRQHCQKQILTYEE